MPSMPYKVLSVGEVLWDVLPDGKTLGGAPANVLCHCRRMGARAFLASAVGEDGDGAALLAALAEMGVDSERVAVVSGKPTGIAEAWLDDEGVARYTILEDAAWDWITASPALVALASRVDAVTFGSLARRTVAGERSVNAIVGATRPDALRVYDVNLRSPHVRREAIESGLRLANIVKMNEEELVEITRMLSISGNGEEAMGVMLEQYSGLRHVIVTRGEKGLWWRSGKEFFRAEPRTKTRVVDTVGAGDSVTAAVIMGLLADASEDDIAAYAVAVASHVCSVRGATPKLPLELCLTVSNLQ